MVESDRADKIVREEVRKLKHNVIVGGDPAAAVTLLGLAVSATEALQSLWSDPTPQVLGAGENTSPSLEARRELLAFLFKGADPLPIFRWEQTSAEHPNQGFFIDGIKNGPLKRRKRKATNMRTLIESVVFPDFSEIQFGARPKRGINHEIWCLPRLEKKTIKRWAGVIVEFVWLKKASELRTKNSDLYNLTGAEDELERAKAGRRRALDTWIKGERKKYGNDGDRESVLQTRVQVKMAKTNAKINGMQVTDSHIKTGLRSEITKYLMSHVSR